MDNQTPTTEPSNGHKPEMSPEIEKQLKGFLNTGDFDGAFNSTASPSAIEKFVERGDKIEDLLLRTNFRDYNHVNAFLRLLYLAKHHHYKELEEMLTNGLAANPSIKGDRINILLKAVVGQLEQENKKSLGSGFRRAIFGDKAEQSK